jgi:hypothetical protein
MRNCTCTVWAQFKAHPIFVVCTLLEEFAGVWKSGVFSLLLLSIKKNIGGVLCAGGDQRVRGWR